MSKRLQVLVPDDEMESIPRQAQQQSLTVGEYVRRALREVAKLAAIRKAATFSFPVTEVEEMNREINRGYTGKCCARQS